MGAFLSQQVQRRKSLSTENKLLVDLERTGGCEFPGSDYRPSDRKNWMSGLGPEKLRINQVVWPGTHDSATNKIGVPFISRPFGRCQSLSIYQQLVAGARALDIRVQEDRRICHGVLLSYSVDIVLDDLEEKLGEHLIRQDERVFEKTISELLPGRVICVWKPRTSPQPAPGSLLWSSGYLKDHWIDTDLPSTKFENNMKHLGDQQPTANRRFFYRVENTATPQADNPILCVKPVTKRIQPYARMFICQCFQRGFGDRLQIFSEDFINEDFVNACVGVTYARVEGKA